MIPNMITLISKYSKVLNPIIILVFVFMVHYMAWLQAKDLGHFRASNSTALSPFNPSTTSVEPGTVAFMIAKMPFLISNTWPGSKHFITTNGAANWGQAFAGINASFPEHLVYCLPGNIVPFSKFNHGDKLNSVGMHYVNNVIASDSHGCTSYQLRLKDSHKYT
uniref:Uncharacterized protein n=1 Tax=viral metagenome TaxID=1070528 RepID=A0A6M3KGY5_9ZZZZ